MANRFYAPGKGSQYKVEGAKPAGFLAGFWHGLIAPITFIFSLFFDNVSSFETANNGKFYELGFLLGVGAFSSRLAHHNRCW
ncbi:MAG: hypothetical protein A2X35_07465 [Elusimicrobia bacterium GWA2_61_42]|nr:MAG: hypothetical protein A2X35_07465 [Elusimicrobia bacterium GWA2_61_42]OGR75051.1 MAG: hypothetical protein A2X38_01615 [Elusimicrobia bacterium GWC2_61_25]